MPRKASTQQREARRLKALEGLPAMIVATSQEPVEILAAEGETGDKLPRFKMVAYTGGLMQPAGWYYPVVVDLEGYSIPRQDTPTLRQHDVDRIVGHSEKIELKGTRILVEGVLSGTGEDAEEIRSTAKNKFPWQCSIGWRVLPGEMKFLDEGEKAQVNGKTFTGPCYIARKTIHAETSFVVFGADSKTSASITGQSSPSLPPSPLVSSMNFDTWLKAGGFDPATITDAQRKFLKAQFDAVQAEAEQDPPATPPATPVNAQGNGVPAPAPTPLNATSTPPAAPAVPTTIAEIRAENVRIQQIGSVCAQFGNPQFTVNGQRINLQAHAVAEGWDLNRTELEARRESRPSAPAGHSHSHEGLATIDAIQGAMLLRAGLTLDSKHFSSISAHALRMPDWLRAGLNDEVRQRAMNAAHRFADMSMVDLCREAVRLDGKYIPSGRQEVIEAALSGGSLTKVFTTNVNASVLVGFLEAPDTTRGWVRENPNVADFQTMDVLRMEKRGGMAKLPRGKTAAHKSLEDTGEQYKIARYAEQLVIDDQDMIDDRFGLLADSPREMSLDAARLRPDLVYAILLANAALADGTALFSTARPNLDTGAALAEATLMALLAQMATQQENGINLNFSATHILTPPLLTFTAEKLLSSVEMMPAAATGGPTANVLRGKIRNVVSEARLENGVTDPNSGTTHAGANNDYYIVDGQYPPIEVGTLRGTGGVPRVRSFVLDRGQWGIGWDVALDIGAKAIRWQSIHKAEG